MAAQTSTLHVHVDDNIKHQATTVLDTIGLSMADAIRILLHRIAADQAYPFELKVPNAETSAAMIEANKIAKSSKARRDDRRRT